MLVQIVILPLQNRKLFKQTLNPTRHKNTKGDLMGEVVCKCGVKRQPGYLYLVNKNGD